MPRKPDAAAELAEKMVRVLEIQRGLGAGSYPLTLRRLAGLTDPLASPTQIEQAAGKKSFSNRVLVAFKKTLDAPAALAADLDLLAGSGLLLESALEAVCTSTRRAWPVSALKTRVVTKLRKPFAAAIDQRIRENSLPPTVGWVQVKKSKHLYLLRLPYVRPSVELADKMVRVLEAQRRLGECAYPLTLKRLVSLTDPEASATLLRETLAEPSFQERVVVALPKSKTDSPVALATDQEMLASSPLLLVFLVEGSRTAKNHVSGSTDWKKKVLPRIWQPFQEAVERRLRDDALPEGVAWVLMNNSRKFFLARDVHGGLLHTEADPRTAPEVQAPKPAARQSPHADFGQAFETAFDRLNRQQGGANFVHLLDLRRALLMERPAFDAGLAELRLARRYTLSAAEGRHDLSPEERAAGIYEDGVLLLYVSRKQTP